MLSWLLLLSADFLRCLSSSYLGCGMYVYSKSHDLSLDQQCYSHCGFIGDVTFWYIFIETSL